nr:hypothetical protein [Tanacetum cinerariifolium]
SSSSPSHLLPCISYDLYVMELIRLTAGLSCSASVIATSERAVRLFALEALAVCLPFAEVNDLMPATVVRGGVTVVSELLFVFQTLALVFGGVVITLSFHHHL